MSCDTFCPFRPSPLQEIPALIVLVGTGRRSQRGGLGCERRRRVWRVRRLYRRARGRGHPEKSWCFESGAIHPAGHLRNASCAKPFVPKRCQRLIREVLLTQPLALAGPTLKLDPCGASVRHASRFATKAPSMNEMKRLRTTVDMLDSQVTRAPNPKTCPRETERQKSCGCGCAVREGEARCLNTVATSADLGPLSPQMCRT